MLRITIEKKPDSTILRVEGKITGPWLAELEQAWQTVLPQLNGTALLVDLTDVTLISEEGKRVLEAMHESGAKFKASGCVTRRVVEGMERSLPRPPNHPRA